MNKKLTARVQKLSRKLDQEAQHFSSTLVIEPDNQDALEKRGTLYATYDIASSTSLDPLLVTKIIHDVLHDSYYSSETVSPIQSLEKAIVHVKDKVTQLPDSASNGMLDFNILAAALWGNVLYMVQFGKGGSFLVRDGEVKPVNSATEGNFSEASGVVRDDDVVILGTQPFIESYSPEDLVSGAVSFSVNDLPDKASALLLKFESIVEFTDDDKIDFGLSEKPEGKREVSIQSRSEEHSIPTVESKKVEPISTLDIAKKVPSKLPKITLASTKRRNIKPIFLVIGVVVILLSGSIFWTVRSRNMPASETENMSEEMVVEDTTEDTGPDTSQDEEYKIVRVDPEVFYDIKIVDENASPTGIAVLDSSVAVVDGNSGKIYLSGIVTPSFEDEGLTFENVKNAQYFGGDLVFTDSEGFKVYDTGEVTESYAGQLGPSAPYLAFIYSINGDSLTKYSKEDPLEGTLWAQSSEFEGAVSLAIDGNIYILRSDGSLLRFLSGAQDNFEITGLDKGFSNPANVVKDVNLGYLYVADSGNNRIVVLDEDGNVVNQYISNNDSWNDIKGVGVTRDESQLFVLSGSKVYTVDL